MSPEKINAQAGGPRELHLVCGAGGSRAILGSAGAILACHHAGIEKWLTIGGASGGSIPTVMLAGGVDPKTIVRTCIDVDFSSLLTRHGSLIQILFAYFMQNRYEKTRPRKGVLGSEKVGQFVDAHVPNWPANYWTVAAVKDKQWLFNAQGIFEYAEDGTVTQICDKPAPVGLAVRASCAVPGIIDAVPFMGKWLFDGALASDGRCPVRVPKKHYAAVPADIVACDVGDDNTKSSAWSRWFWKVLCGEECLPKEIPQPVDAHDVVLLRPSAMNFRSLQFTLSEDQKWEAVMSGFTGAIPTLKSAGLITGARLEAAERITAKFAELRNAATADGDIAAGVEKLLVGEGLY